MSRSKQTKVNDMSFFKKLFKREPKTEVEISENGEEVKIGNQVWMTKNLNVDKFRNGDPIPEVKTHKEWDKAGLEGKPAWCYYDNDSANGEKYGKLYNWHAVYDPRGLAPEGWGTPSDEDWSMLTDFLGGEDVAGKKIKFTDFWKKRGNGTNESGLSFLPGGVRSFDGKFAGIDGNGFWWSSTEHSVEDGPIVAWIRYLNYKAGSLGRNYSLKEEGLSVRCIKGSASVNLKTYELSISIISPQKFSNNPKISLEEKLDEIKSVLVEYYGTIQNVSDWEITEEHVDDIPDPMDKEKQIEVTVKGFTLRFNSPLSIWDHRYPQEPAENSEMDVPLRSSNLLVYFDEKGGIFRRIARIVETPESSTNDPTNLNLCCKDTDFDLDAPLQYSGPIDYETY